MPFITLNNDWSRLAPLYNQAFRNKPEVPSQAESYTLSDDGFIRGGAKNVLLSTTKDLIRVGKFITGKSSPGTGISSTTGYEKFINSAKGYSFFVRQIGLQRSNPKLEKNRGNVLSGVAGVLGGPTRTFTGAGLLASVGGNAFGLHFDRAGIFGVIPDNQKYGGDVDSPRSGVVYSNNFIDRDTNLKISEKSHNRLLEYTAKLFNNISGSNEVTLDSYLGGPNSLYGIVGRTRTKSYFDTTFINRVEDINKLGGRLNGFFPLTNKEIDEYEKPSSPSLKTVLAASPFYNKSIGGTGAQSNNIEDRAGVSSFYDVDSINIINIVDSKVFYDDNKNKKSSDVKATSLANLDDKTVNGDFGKDLIKFRIEFLNNDVTGYKSTDGRISPNTDVLAFRAYIDSFDDGMSAKWSSYRYMGRGDEFYVYDGFTRDIGVSFTMFAHTRQEMKPLYDKLNYLMSSFTPDYSSKLKMRGNIGYLTVGDYLYRQPGVFTDIKLSNFFEGPWDIGLDSDNFNYPDTMDNELPMMLKVSLSFKPIHTFLPRKSSKDNKVPFIGRDLNTYPIKKETQNNNQNSQPNPTQNPTQTSGANPTSTVVGSTGSSLTTNNTSRTFNSGRQQANTTRVQPTSTNTEVILTSSATRPRGVPFPQSNPSAKSQLFKSLRTQLPSVNNPNAGLNIPFIRR